MAKRIVTVALTGAVTPAGYNVPETPEQICEQVLACREIGASVAHLHMRDDQGAGIMDPVKFYKTIKLIREAGCDIIVNCTSSGDNRVSDDSPYGNAMRVLHHKLLPGIEMGTFDASSFNWGIPGGVFHNSPTFLSNSGKLFQQRGIKPEFEIFDLGALRAIGAYWKQGYVKEPLHFQFCLGVMGGMDASPEQLQILLTEMRRLQSEGALPKEITWSGFGIGKGHLPVMFSCIANGGGIRVGMEDNVVYGRNPDGTKIMATNMMLVQRAVNAVRAFGDEPATPDEARAILSLPALDIEKVKADLAAVNIDDLEAAKQAVKDEFGGPYFASKGMGGK